MIYYFIMVLSVLIASISQIILKIGANKKYDSLTREYLNFYVIGGYSLLILSTIITIIAYKGISYTSGPMIESLGYIFVLTLSYFVLKEKITKQMIIGNILIIIGIIVFYL